MASSNQYSRGLRFFLASLVLLSFLAITVESRAVSFNAPLLPEFAGKVSSSNKNYVGQAIGYVSLRGRNAFGLYVLALANIDPTKVSRVSLYYTSSTKKVIANLTYDKTGGFYTLDERIDYNTGADIHQHLTSVGVWLKDKKKETLVISGPFANNRTTFISYLNAASLVTAPTGTTKNVGFAAIHLYTNDSVNYFINAAINHDVTDKITSISLNGPAPSGTDNNAYQLTLTLQDKSGRVFGTHVNSTVYYWFSNHLINIKIFTAKNPNGALEGQVIPLTAPRARIPLFPNGLTQIIHHTEVTYLPGGESIIGNLTLALLSGGAHPSNKTIGTVDDRVAYFFYNNISAFNYTFRFELPVTLVNRFNTRGAQIVFTAAAEVVDTSKWQIGLYNLAQSSVQDPFPIPGNGNKTYTTVTADLAPQNFGDYLGPGGIFVNVHASNVANPLFVDRFYTIYYVASSLSNSIVRRIFASGSSAANRDVAAEDIFGDRHVSADQDYW